MVELDFSIIGQRIKEVRNERNLTQEYILNSRLKIIHCSQSFDFSNFLQNSV